MLRYPTLPRSSGNAPGLPGSALTRRGALSGAAAIALSLAAGAVAQAAPLHPDDTRLIELADAHAAVEAACNAHTAAHLGRSTSASEDAFGDIVSGFLPIEAEIAATSADSLAGIVAKARVCRCKTEPDQDVFRSLADDVWRLFGGDAA